MIIDCSHCGSPFNRREKAHRFCSKSCAAKHNNVRFPKRAPRSSRLCKQCGTKTTNKVYCSATCHNQGQVKNGTPAERAAIRRAAQNEAWARYSARKKWQTPSDEDLSLIKEFYRLCPSGFEVDHKIPISRGGLHSISNLQYLPASVNRRKAAKTNAEFFGHDQGSEASAL